RYAVVISLNNCKDLWWQALENKIYPMPTELFLQTPETFSFRHTVYSHGWSDLPPFELDSETWRLRYVFREVGSSKPVSAVISESDGGLKIEASSKRVDEQRLSDQVRHI